MDPGSGSGSGNAYEQAKNPNSNNPENSNQSDADPGLQNDKSPEALAHEQIGMSEVVKDFLEQKKSETHASPGLSIRYTLDAQPAKGLLLNKKVE